MLKNITKRQHIEHVTYTHQFERKKRNGGFAFDCDADGTPHRAGDAERIAKLQADPEYDDNGVVEYRRMQHIPGDGRCVCGATVTLYGFTNTCDCGRDYNMSGYLLADRSQWGEETGESVADILAADSDAEIGGDL